MNIGVIAIQGAVTEHLEAVEKAILEFGVEGRVVPIRKKEQLDDLDGLIIPGGESTTISKLLDKWEMSSIITEKAGEGMPILGTCAGCILLAKKGDEEVEKTGTLLLGLMDMKVNRNAFGRQRESFETDIRIRGFEKPYRAVFIRAPAILSVWGDCIPLGSVEDKIVLARQGNLIAAAFHPELTEDMRIHMLLLKMIMGDDIPI